MVSPAEQDIKHIQAVNLIQVDQVVYHSIFFKSSIVYSSIIREHTPPE